uniref:Uncharacterized protein n=1 Tax=Nephromyces sp. ex Molgula occidentalis TaxID=2544991 RepID=A0A5C1H817_9APIC|nr:hypothetical protein [Nephromyces sp. ex Molgula occidentalis]
MSIFTTINLLKTNFITKSNQIKHKKCNTKLAKSQYTYIRKLILQYRSLGLLSISNKQIWNIL